MYLSQVLVEQSNKSDCHYRRETVYSYADEKTKARGDNPLLALTSFENKLIPRASLGCKCCRLITVIAVR